MDEDLRKKLKSYFSAPADASVTVKLAGWTEDDFKKLDVLGILDPRTPEECERYLEIRKECLGG